MNTKKPNKSRKALVTMTLLIALTALSLTSCAKSTPIIVNADYYSYYVSVQQHGELKDYRNYKGSKVNLKGSKHYKEELLKPNITQEGDKKILHLKNRRMKVYGIESMSNVMLTEMGITEVTGYREMQKDGLEDPKVTKLHISGIINTQTKDSYTITTDIELDDIYNVQAISTVQLNNKNTIQNNLSTSQKQFLEVRLSEILDLTSAEIVTLLDKLSWSTDSSFEIRVGDTDNTLLNYDSDTHTITVTRWFGDRKFSGITGNEEERVLSYIYLQKIRSLRATWGVIYNPEDSLYHTEYNNIFSSLYTDTATWGNEQKKYLITPYGNVRQDFKYSTTKKKLDNAQYSQHDKALLFDTIEFTTNYGEEAVTHLAISQDKVIAEYTPTVHNESLDKIFFTKKADQGIYTQDIELKEQTDKKGETTKSNFKLTSTKEGNKYKLTIK